MKFPLLKKIQLLNTSKKIVYSLGASGFVVGGVYGIDSWMAWCKNYTPIEFKNPYFKFLSPVVNTSIYTGNLILKICYHGMPSALIAMTFIISVPTLLYLSDDKSDVKTDDKSDVKTDDKSNDK